MSARPEIFISCVSGEFRSTRQQVANALLSLGFTPVFQEIFGIDPGAVRDMLRAKIDGCHALLQIAGEAYGAEPPTPEPEFGRVSYTQFEFLYAQARGIKAMVLFAGPGCVRDTPPDALDLPPGEPGPDAGAYQAERRALQAEYRRARRDTRVEESLFFDAESDAHLVLTVHTLRDHLTELRKADNEWRAGVAAALATIREDQTRVAGRVEAKLDDAAAADERRHGETAEGLKQIREKLEKLLSGDKGGGAKVLLAVDLEGSPNPLTRTGPPTEVDRVFDAAVAQLLERHAGWELERAGGLLLLFERPIHAVAFALSLHAIMAEFETRLGVKLRARVAANLGEVFLRDAPGAAGRTVQVDGIAKMIAGKVLAIAQAGQTLLTRSVFDLAKGATPDGDDGLPEETRWVTHGPYFLKDVSDTQEIFEVGVRGVAPLAAPPDSGHAKRAVSPDEAELLGWRPFPGVPLPGRANWRVARKLGQGGFGEAWLVEQPKSRQRRVLKYCFDPAHLTALKRDVALLRLLSENPEARGRVATVIDWNLDSPPHFVELEYYEHGSLETYAESQGGMGGINLVRRMKLVLQVAEALDFAHRQGILHRDIKPSNILVEQDKDGRERALLADFGIGTVLDKRLLAEVGVTADGMTTGGTVASGAGTRMYIAPELLEGKPASVASDIYAFGITMYQILVGDLHRAMGHGWTDNIYDNNLRDLVALCIHQNPDKRARDAKVAITRLKTLLGNPGLGTKSAEDKSEESAYALASRAGRKPLKESLLPKIRLPKIKWPAWTIPSILFVMLVGGMGYTALPDPPAGVSRLGHSLGIWGMAIGMGAPSNAGTVPKPSPTPGSTPSVAKKPDSGSQSEADKDAKEKKAQYAAGFQAAMGSGFTVQPPVQNIPQGMSAMASDPTDNPIAREKERQRQEALRDEARQSGLLDQRRKAITKKLISEGVSPAELTGVDVIEFNARRNAARSAAAAPPPPSRYPVPPFQPLGGEQSSGRDLTERMPVGLSISPSRPVPGGYVTFYFNAAGTPLAGSRQVSAQIGTNNWSTLLADRIPMSQSYRGTWTYQIQVPVGATTIELLFLGTVQGREAIDNNNGRGWSILLANPSESSPN